MKIDEESLTRELGSLDPRLSRLREDKLDCV